jgi:hypothetical protein
VAGEVDAGSAAPGGECAPRRRPQKRCDRGSMGQGYRAASCLWQVSATRVAGFAAMCFHFSIFLFAALILQFVV